MALVLLEQNQYNHLKFMVAPNQFYAAGKTIFKEGDPPGWAYLVKSGKVQLFKGESEKKITLAILEANGIFGEMALLDNKPRSASAVALENTYCIILDKEGLESRLNALDPFMRGLFRILTHRLRDTSNLLAMLSKSQDSK